MESAAPVCRECARPLENPQRCRACGAFQPPDPRRDHFLTLALPRRFEIDESLLERRLVEFGRDLHPDKVGDGCQRAFAVLAAAQVNEAYGILKDPYRRGEYLLRLEGGKSANEDKAVPPGFLESMLEERETLEQALDTGGEEVERARRGFEQKLRELGGELARAFARLPPAGAPAHVPSAVRDAELSALRRTLNVMAYYRGLLRDLRETERLKEGA
jgi:molecular chaperone HscB